MKRIIFSILVATVFISGCDNNKEDSERIKAEELLKAEKIAAAQDEYDLFVGTAMPNNSEEGFFSRTKNDLNKVRTANISSRGGAFRIAKDQDGYRNVISRQSYAGNTIVKPEAIWKSGSKDRLSRMYAAFQMHCIDSYVEYMEVEKHMPQDNFKVKEVFVDSGNGYYPSEDDRSMTSDMIIMVAYGKHAWGAYSTKEYAVKLKCSMDNERNIRWQSNGY